MMSFLRSLFARFSPKPGSGGTAKASPAEMMRQMRAQWLSRTPEPGSYKTPEEVTAVVLDYPMGEQVISILSSSLGDASLYTTATFGILGGIGHEKVRKASVAFVGCAQHFLPLMKPTNEFPYPDGQSFTVYAVTAAGTRTVSFPMKEVEKDKSAARALYFYAQNVLTELRQTVPPPK